MYSFKTTFRYAIRRAGMVIGFAFFIFFAYRASHDVSNAKIAAGAQRKQNVSVIGRTDDDLKVRSPGSEAYVMMTSQQPTKTATIHEATPQKVGGTSSVQKFSEVSILPKNDKAINGYTKPIKTELNTNLQNARSD